ncbi:MAG: CAP domain-containing protein [bacterium]
MMKKVGVILGLMVLLIGNVNIRIALSQYYSYSAVNPDLSPGYWGSGSTAWGSWDNSSWNGFNSNLWSGLGGTNWNTLSHPLPGAWNTSGSGSFPNSSWGAGMGGTRWNSPQYPLMGSWNNAVQDNTGYRYGAGLPNTGWGMNFGNVSTIGSQSAAGNNWSMATFCSPGTSFGLGSNGWSGWNSSLGSGFGSAGSYQSGWTGSGNMLWGGLDYSGWSYPSGNFFYPLAGTWPNRTAQSYTPTTKHYEEDIPADTLVLKVHQLVNEYRSSKDLSPLIHNEVIAQQARNHSLSMFNDNVGREKVVISHDGFAQRVDEIAKDIPYIGAAENVGWNKGYSDPAQRIVDRWISSSGHRENMEGNYRLTGIGISGDSQSGYYFTQIFIRPQ